MEERNLWFRLLNGEPQTCAWGFVKTTTTDPFYYESALNGTQLEVDGWDAVETAWRKVPQLIFKHIILDTAANTSYSNGELIVGGCKYLINDEGLNGEPTAEILSLEDLVTLSESVNEEIVFVEKDTYKKIKVFPTEPAEPFIDPSIASAVYRSAGIASRFEAS